jgi:VIT1/CCC1 family predicted Fe2+/Mn2+ transporter
MTKNERSSFIKASVLGANDGIITTFAVVAGVVGANLPVQTILILGVANMIADGISMSVGDYLGESSAAQYEKSQTGEERRILWKTSIATFVAFVVAGSLPLLPYMIQFLGVPIPADWQFTASIISTATALFLVGSLRTIIIKGNWFKSGLEMLAIGAIAATVAYALGAYIEQLISK